MKVIAYAGYQGEQEPRALVDIPHSIVAACAGRYFQSFRLYVVYDKPDRDSVIDELTTKVRGWGS